MTFRSVARVAALGGPTAVLLMLIAARSTFAYPGDVFASAAPVRGPSVAANTDIPSGTYSVSTATGAAQYSVAVPVPPGRNGVAPKLALVYSSSNPIRGGVAMGWELHGIPSIYVDTSQGRLSGTYYASSLAGGQRLVDVPEPGAPPGVRTMRAEHDDTWARYEKHADHWVVRLIDGTVMYFGEQPDARDTLGEGRWFITRIVDRFGNTASYVYEKTKAPAWHDLDDEHPADITPWLISYTSNSAAGLSDHARVVFEYAPGLELCPGSTVPVGAAFDYRTGVGIYRGARRLTAIRTLVRDHRGGHLRDAHRIDLGYNAGALGYAGNPDELTTGTLTCEGTFAPVRQLDSVQQTGCDRDLQCLSEPPVRFTYGPLSPSFEAPEPLPAHMETGNLGRGDRRYNLDKPGGWPSIERMLIDLDGDGELDVLRSLGAFGTACGYTVEYGGRGATTLPPRALPAFPWKGSAAEHPREGCSLAGQFSERNTRFDPPLGANYFSYRFMDVTGDGRVELVTQLSYKEGSYHPADDHAVLEGMWGEIPALPGAPCRKADGGEIPCLLRAEDSPGVPYVDIDDPGDPGDPSTCGEGMCRTPQCDTTPWECCTPCSDPTPAPVFSPDPPDRGPTLSDWDNLGTPLMVGGSADDVTGVSWFAGPLQQPDMRNNYYILRIFQIDDDGRMLDARTVASPVPLESGWASARLGSGDLAEASSWHGYVDMDSDGCTDAVYQVPAHFGIAWDGGFQVFRGDCTGQFRGKPDGEPYLWSTPAISREARISYAHTGLIPTSCDEPMKLHGVCLGHSFSVTDVSLRDMNGDDLPDYVESRGLVVPGDDNEFALRVFYNTGTGFEDTGPTGTIVTRAFAPIERDETRTLHFERSTGHVKSGWSQARRRTLDLDGDRLLDVIEIPGITQNQVDPYEHLLAGDGEVVVYMNTGVQLVRHELPAGHPWRQHLVAFARLNFTDGEKWAVRSDALDIDGDGQLELLTQYLPTGVCDTESNDRWYAAPECAGGLLAHGEPNGRPLRALTAIDNGRGGTVELDYRPATDRDVVTRTHPSFRVAGPLWVVHQTTVQPDADPTRAMTTTYHYVDPVSNHDERGRFGFRGFSSVEITQAANASGLYAHQVDRYDYSVDPTGRPAASEIYELDGVSERALSITDTVWQPLELFDGAVRTYHVAETRSYTCDDATVTAETCRSAGAVKREITGWGAIVAGGDVDGAFEGSAAPASDGPTMTELAELWSPAPAVLPAGAEVSAPESARPPVCSLDSGGLLDAGDTAVMYAPCATRITESRGSVAAGDRGAATAFVLLTDHDTYLLLDVETRRYEAIGPGTVEGAWGAVDLIGRVKTIYDDGELGLPVQTRTWLTATTVAVTRRAFDLDTGNLLSVQRPNQVAASSWRHARHVYDDHELYPEQTINEMLHRFLTERDFGTGAVVFTGGPYQSGVGYPGTTTEYDPLGRPVATYRNVAVAGAIEQELTSTTEYFDDERPMRIRTTAILDAATGQDVVTERYLDGLDRLVEEIVAPDSDAATTSYRYDGAGHIVELAVPDPRDGAGQVVHRYQRDSRGRVTLYTNPLDQDTQLSYDGLVTTRIGTSTEVNAPPSRVETTHDVFGRLRAVVEDAGDRYADPIPRATTIYEYDANDNLAFIQDADDIITELDHDLGGRRVAVHRAGETWRYAYDRHGNLVCERPPLPTGVEVPEGLCEGDKRYEIEIVYDDLDRVVTRDAGPRDLSDADQLRYAIGATHYTYDSGDLGTGRLALVVVGAEQARIAYDHDLDGRVVQETRRFDVRPWGGTWDARYSDERTIRRSYNTAGMPTVTEHADGTTVTEATYDDRRGLPRALLLDGAEAVRLERNGAGLPVKRVTRWPRTQYQQWRYDVLGRVKDHFVTAYKPDGVTYTSVAGEIISHWSTGNIHTIRHRGLGVHVVHTYDRQNQLIGAWSYNDGREAFDASYRYSLAGRVLEASVASSVPDSPVAQRHVVYDYDGIDGAPSDPAAVRRLLPASAPDGAAYAEYDYDERGGVVRRVVDGEELVLIYDGDEQLREVINLTAGAREVYYYDHASQRMLAFRTAFDGQPMRGRQWFAETEVAYTDFGPGGATEETTVHASLGGMPIAQIVDGDADAARFVYNNVLGSLMGVFDGNAVPIMRVWYGPYGEIIAQEGDLTDQDRLFNGKVRDDISGLSYYGFRYYDKAAITWTQMDMLYRFVPDIAYDEPRRMGLYSFSLNNPLLYVDPDGLDGAVDWYVEYIIEPLGPEKGDSGWTSARKITTIVVASLPIGLGLIYAYAGDEANNYVVRPVVKTAEAGKDLIERTLMGPPKPLPSPLIPTEPSDPPERIRRIPRESARVLGPHGPPEPPRRATPKGTSPRRHLPMDRPRSSDARGHTASGPLVTWSGPEGCEPPVVGQRDTDAGQDEQILRTLQGRLRDRDNVGSLLNRLRQLP